MSNKIILIVTMLFVVSIFVFSMAFVAYKNYKKEQLRRNLRRKLQSSKKDDSLKDLLNLRFNKLEKMFVRAGIDTIYIDDVVLCIVAFFIVILGISMIFDFGIFIIIIPILLVGIGIGSIKRRAEKRISLINKQFCDSLDDIGDDLRVNRNLYISIKNSLPSMQSPLREEFELVCKKVESNVDIVVALQSFADRTGNNMIQGWVDAIIFASEKKSNVSDVCKIYNRKIKQRLRTAESVKAKLQGVKFMAIMILGILLSMIVMFYSTTPEFYSFLITPMGKGGAIYTAISITITTVFIFNTIDKEVNDV